MKIAIPIYDITKIDQSVNPNLLIEPLGGYLSKHYSSLQRPHRHSFYHLVLFTSGTGTHTIDFETFTVEPYQMYFMIPGQVHSWQFKGTIQGYIVHFGEDLFNSFLYKQDYLKRFSFFSGNCLDGVLKVHRNVQKVIEGIFKQLLAATNTDPQNIDLIRVLLLELFIRVEISSAKIPYADAHSSTRILTQHFKQLVDDNFRELKLPKDYARLLYVTPNHLNAVCRDLLGISAGDVIRKRIVLEAKRLLANAGMDINEIGIYLNFQDNSYFSRYFKKYVGMSPEKFRKSLNKQL